MIIGLTGGIASGKSLVAACLQELGVPVIDTDDIARQVVAPGQPAWQRLSELFGPDVFLPDGALDRAAVAARVFADPAARLALEAITHPAIFAEVDRRIAALRAAGDPPLIVVVVPLLYEVGAADRFDAVVVVHAAPDQQRDRLRRTRGYTDAQIDARLAAQLPAAEKRARADYVLDNTGDPAATRARVRALVAALRARA
ncbi:MAG TPA: dephospho-CoA kinase [Armatimonadota bacterium]|nr:dephospho-CoA kinase [Armatimonadota bacterium]